MAFLEEMTGLIVNTRLFLEMTLRKTLEEGLERREETIKIKATKEQ